MERFYFQQCISESHIFTPPKQISTKAKIAAANEEWKKGGERETYFPYLITLGSICGNIPVISSDKQEIQLST